MNLRDTLLQLGYVLIAAGAVFATWALLTGPLARFTDRARGVPRERRSADDVATPGSEDDPKSGSS